MSTTDRTIQFGVFRRWLELAGFEQHEGWWRHSHPSLSKLRYIKDMPPEQIIGMPTLYMAVSGLLGVLGLGARDLERYIRNGMLPAALEAIAKGETPPPTAARDPLLTRTADGRRYDHPGVQPGTMINADHLSFLVPPAGGAHSAIVDMSPLTALIALANYALAGQRALAPATVNSYQHAMQAGRWELSTLTFAYVPSQDTYFLIDGYHRLSALANVAGDAVRIPFTVTIVETESPAVLYSVTDRGRKRSAGDSLTVLGVPQRFGLPVTWLNQCGTALAYVRSAFRPTKEGTAAPIQAYERIEFLDQWADEVHTLHDLMTGGVPNVYRDRLMVAPIVAVMLVTLRYAPSMAKPFWAALARRDNIAANSVAHKFAAYLDQYRAGRVGGTYNHAANAIIFWNAYVNGSQPRWNKESTPAKQLAGCKAFYEDAGPAPIDDRTRIEQAVTEGLAELLTAPAIAAGLAGVRTGEIYNNYLRRVRAEMRRRQQE